MQLGKHEWHLIHDGTTLVDGGGAFGLVPRALWAKHLSHDDHNLVPMMLHNLVIQTCGKNIVVDTGFGDKLSAKLQAIWHLQRPNGSLLDGLARLGLQPADIDIVINTHLHGDHCSGNTHYATDGQVVPVFPKAEYIVHRLEYTDAMKPNERTRATYHVENYLPLAERGQLTLVDQDEVEIVPGVFVVRTPGHTPGHMAVRLESQGEHALFVADMATYMVHFEKLGWMTAYDVEPLVTLETKRLWQQWALTHHALIISAHDHQCPVGRMVLEDGRLKVVPEDVPYS